MNKRYSARDQHRINEMKIRLKELERVPSAHKAKEIKEMGEEIKRIELRNSNRNTPKISRFY